MKVPTETIREQYDGVIPTHYPHAYADLDKWDCVTKLRTTNVVYIGHYTLNLTCEDCFRSENYSPYEINSPCEHWHSTSYKEFTKLECQNCEKPLLIAQPLINCCLCMDAYFNRKEAANRL